MKIVKDRLLTLREILINETDSDHPITVVEIISRLNADGFTADRKTVYKDIETLKAHGVNIAHERKRQNQYYIINRDFTLSELTLLVDAVQAAKFVSVKDSNALIKKLSALTSVHQADKLKRRLYVEKYVKSANEKVLHTADLLHTAVNRGLKVEFQYFEYNASKKKEYKHNGQVYSFSPYGLLWSNDCYYALGYSDSHGKIITFRVDRIANPVLTKWKSVPRPKGFKPEEYSKSVFQMYDGEQQTVTIRCENDLMKSVIDRFGEKVKTALDGNEHFTAEVDVSVSNTFFGWIVGFGGRMEIIAPDDVKQQYRDTLILILEKSHE